MLLAGLAAVIVGLIGAIGSHRCTSKKARTPVANLAAVTLAAVVVASVLSGIAIPAELALLRHRRHSQ